MTVQTVHAVVEVPVDSAWCVDQNKMGRIPHHNFQLGRVVDRTYNRKYIQAGMTLLNVCKYFESGQSYQFMSQVTLGNSPRRRGAASPTGVYRPPGPLCECGTPAGRGGGRRRVCRPVREPRQFSGAPRNRWVRRATATAAARGRHPTCSTAAACFAVCAWSSVCSLES